VAAGTSAPTTTGSSGLAASSWSSVRPIADGAGPPCRRPLPFGRVRAAERHLDQAMDGFRAGRLFRLALNPTVQLIFEGNLLGSEEIRLDFATGTGVFHH
jgi:hypothetical protein